MGGDEKAVKRQTAHTHTHTKDILRTLSSGWGMGEAALYREWGGGS